MKPLEPLLPGETRSEYLDRLERAPAPTRKWHWVRPLAPSLAASEFEPAAVDYRDRTAVLVWFAGNEQPFEAACCEIGPEIQQLSAR